MSYINSFIRQEVCETDDKLIFAIRPTCEAVIYELKTYQAVTITLLSSTFSFIGQFKN